MISHLGSIKLERVIGSSEDGKFVSIVGSLREDSSSASTSVSSTTTTDSSPDTSASTPKNESQALILIKSLPLNTPDTLSSLFQKDTPLELIIHNDKYYTYRGFAPIPTKFDITFPALESDIARFETQKRKFVRETPEMYKNISLPQYVQKIPPSKIAWVWNIIEGRNEQGSILHRGSDFVLIPDMKWDQKNISTLYCLAISAEPGLLSIRDLREYHVPMLKAIKKISAQAIDQKFGVPENQLRMYVHYLPTFYQLHVHINHIESYAEGGCNVGKAILLDDIVDNLERNGNYYQEASLTIILGEKHELYGLL